MAKVRLTSDHVVWAKPNVSVLYRAGSTVLAPRDHIAEIVAAGRGQRIEDQDQPPPEKPESTASVLPKLPTL
jgi:hypothetical protein